MQVLVDDDIISMCSYGRKVGEEDGPHLSHSLANKYSLPCRLWEHAADDISASCTYGSECLSICVYLNNPYLRIALHFPYIRQQKTTKKKTVSAAFCAVVCRGLTDRECICV